MANFQVTIYFNNEGDLTQSLVLDVIADDEDEAIELVEEEVEIIVGEKSITVKSQSDISWFKEKITNKKS